MRSIASQGPGFLVLCLLVAPVLAGCLSSAETNPSFVATAEDGAWYAHWDYAAETKGNLSGTLTIDVDEVENSGVVVARGTMDDQNFTIRLETFEQVGGDFQSGGIAANFDEHGDSGVGNTLLPKMHLLLATWGPGTFKIEDEAVYDDFAGSDAWDAHLMVTSTGVRDDATGKVLDANGTEPYDPDEPGDATIGTDHEAHLILTSTYPNATLEPLNFTKQGQIEGVAGSHSFAVEMPVGLGRISVDVTTGGEPGSAVGSYTWRLVDPGGNVHDAATTLVGAQPTTVSLQANANMSGSWQVRGSSSMAPANYSADVSVIFPPRPMYAFVWENVTISEQVVQ